MKRDAGGIPPNDAPRAETDIRGGPGVSSGFRAAFCLSNTTGIVI
jgi:hypothetical protein